MALNDERDICHDDGDAAVFIPNYFAQSVFFALCLYLFDEPNRRTRKLKVILSTYT